MDYDTLTVHTCKNGDITRYNNFLERQKKLAAARKSKITKKEKMLPKPTAKTSKNTIGKKKVSSKVKRTAKKSTVKRTIKNKGK